EGHRIASTLDLAGVCDRIKVPALYVTGARDRLIPWRQTERQAAETPDGTFVNFPDGNHGVSNLPSKARPPQPLGPASQPPATASQPPATASQPRDGQLGCRRRPVSRRAGSAQVR